MNSTPFKSLLLIIIICLIGDVSLIGQKKEIIFDQCPIDSVFFLLQKHTEYIFNYDPVETSKFLYSGTLPLDDIPSKLDEVLHSTPFEHELKNKSILIFESGMLQYKICGTIINDQKESLPFASILLEAQQEGTFSNENGYFESTIKALRNQMVTISYLGFQSTTLPIHELASQDCPTITLTPDPNLWINEIIVTDYLLDGLDEGANYGGLSLKYQQQQQFHSFIEYDVLKTIQLLPGITSTDESASNFQIRGSSIGQNLIVWEGAPVYQSGHLFGMISAINPFSVDQIEIFKGSHNPRYDNRVGGIVDITLSDSIPKKIKGSAGLTLTESHLNLNIPLYKNILSISVAGRNSINQLFESPPFNRYTEKVFQYSKIDDLSEYASQGSIDAEQSLDYYDFNTKLIFNPTDRLSFTTSIFSNRQQFQYNLSFVDDPFTTSDKIDLHNNIITSRIKYKFSNQSISSIKYMKSEYSSKYDYGEVENSIILRDYIQSNYIDDQSIGYHHDYTFNKNIKVSAGYEYNIKSVDYSIEDESTYAPRFEDINTERGNFHNIYASVNYSLPKWNFQGGTRHTYYQEQNKWVHSPRFSLQYLIQNHLKFKLEMGIYHQFISQLRDYGTFAVAGDLPLWILNTHESQLSQRAQKLASGFIFNREDWLIDIEGYYNKTNDLSTLTPIFSTVNDNWFARGNSESFGLDLLVKKRWSKFSAWANYSLGKINFLFPDILSASFTAPNDIRHNMSITSSYRHKNFQIAMSGYYHSGLPFSQATGIDSIYNDEIDETYYVPDFEFINNARLRSYFRLDLNLNYTHTFEKWDNVKVECSLSFINLLNRTNVFAREYYTEFDEMDQPTLAYIEKILLSRTPLLMVRVYW